MLSAYRRFIDAPEFRTEVGPGAVTLREWLEAVGAVESRAFGFKVRRLLVTHTQRRTGRVGCCGAGGGVLSFFHFWGAGPIYRLP